MKFTVFIKKHKIKLDKKTFNLCIEGLGLMDKSIDAIHDRKHIEEIFGNFDFLLKKLPDIKSVVKWDSLLLAICWHDTWKSFRNAKNPLNFLFHQFFEGLGSARLFKKRAEAQKLNSVTINKTSFIIRKHSFFQFLPTNDLAVKVLVDLDDIELWNVDRLRSAETTFFINKRGIYKKIQKVFYKVIARKKLYFAELEELAEIKKKEFMDFFFTKGGH